MTHPALEPLALLEHLFFAGLAKGRIDVETMAQLIRRMHQPRALASVPIAFDPLLWALDQLPEDFLPNDTVWVVAEELFDQPARTFERLGPSEWVRAGNVSDARRTAFALATVMAVSLQLRETLAGEEVLGDLALEIAQSKVNNEQPAEYDWSLRLAIAIELEPERMLQAITHRPNLVERFVRLAQMPFLPTLRTRGLEESRPSRRAVDLWQELLATLASMQADGRPLAVWLAPLSVADLVSPYTREVRPLLEKWATETAQLGQLQNALASGDDDAAYVCADLFCLHHPQVAAERDAAEQTAGLLTLVDAAGQSFARIIDPLKLDIGALDGRLGIINPLEAPLVVVLNHLDSDVGHALGRLLCDVQADFRGVFIAASSRGTSPGAIAVARTEVLETLSAPQILVAAADEVPTVRVLGVPDAAYLQVVPPSLWAASGFVLVANETELQQAALCEARLRGDLGGLLVEQSLWREAMDTADALFCRREQNQQAVRIWRGLLGSSDVGHEVARDVGRDGAGDVSSDAQPTERSRAPILPAVGEKKKLTVPPYRFRV